MIIKIVNPNNLSEEQVDRTVKRVKAVMLNDKQEVIICQNNGSFSFVGGHIEGDETALQALKREVKEETGISIDKYDHKPVMQLKSFHQNYFDSGKSCLSIIYYYLIQTNKEIDLTNLNLDENEKLGNFGLFYIPLQELSDTLHASESYENKKGLYDEMLVAADVCLDELAKGNQYQF